MSPDNSDPHQRGDLSFSEASETIGRGDQSSAGNAAARTTGNGRGGDRAEVARNNRAADDSESSSPGRSGSRSGSRQGGNSSRPSSAGSKMMAVKVLMLDDSITLFQVQTKAPGRILFDQVCKQLNLLEVDYFGLEYQDAFNVTYWLDLDKQMNHQVGLSSSSSSQQPPPGGTGGSSSEPLLRFCVKFYTPDPAQIEEEYTRYLFSLQIKRDLSLGQLQCNDNTAALMASYIVQAECGDYVVEDYPDHTYLSTFKFVPQQDSDLERRIMENHKKHLGQSPAEADLNLLETARRCELYGTKMHAAKDHEGVPLNLAVSNSGVLVFQNFTKINTFSWAKIRKLSFKRKKFLIKLHPEGYGYYKDTVEFYFEDRNHCKNFWKKCVEHHTFFRCSATVQRERERRRLLSRGSSFRYSGKTQKQMQEYVRENFVKRQSFQRHVRNLHSSLGNVGQSLSAQPLLPIGDNGVAGQPFSLSCGAMTFGELHDLTQPRLTFGDLQGHSSSSEQQPRFHQSANNTPRRTHEPISFGYATLASPYSKQQQQHQAPSYRHSLHGGVPPDVLLMDSDAEATSCSVSGTDLRSENTVVEKARRASSASRRSSNRSNVSQSSTGNFEHVSSEDNLSHESYELIEKDEDLVVVETRNNNHLVNNNTLPKAAADANKFEKEFYRQAGGTAAIVVGPVSTEINHSGSSKLSSISSSSSLMTLPQSNTMSTVISLNHYQTADSNVVVPILKQAVRRKTSSSSAHSQQLQQQQSGGSSRQSLAEYYDVVRAPPAQKLAQDFRNFHPSGAADMPDLVRQRALQTQTLPRMPKQQQHQQQHPAGLSPSEKYYAAFHLNSRTLPNRRRDKSPVFYTRGRPAPADISSASSSSHASPKMSRPKSLDFAVVAAHALPNKDAFSYQDDTLDQPSSQLVQTEYDDSSSAISGLNELNYGSSSDVPQTPEMPTVQFPGFSMDAVVFREGSYYEERIYDVPEGIEGITDHITIATSPKQLASPAPPPLPPHKSAPALPPSADPSRRRFKTQVMQHHLAKRVPIRLPPPPRTLLPTMSSTESESALSARSAPTPVGNPETLIQMATDRNQKGELVTLGLISPPEESESSTAVMESENVPAPPEFSGAGVIADNKDDREDTDVEEEEDMSTLPRKEELGEQPHIDIRKNSSSAYEEEEPESPMCGDAAEDITTSRESTVKRKLEASPSREGLDEDDDEMTAAECAGDETDDFMGSVITMESPPTVFGEETESTDQPNEMFKIADMYVRLGNGSTISSNGDSDSVRYIDDESNGNNGTRKDAVKNKNQATEEDISPQISDESNNKPTDDAANVPLPPKDLLVLSVLRPKLMLHSSESSDGSLDIASIPPPLSIDVIGPSAQPEEVTKDETQNANLEADSSAFLQRTLSRISEHSSSDKPSGGCSPRVNEREEEEDTLSEPNYTTSEDNDNPPSLNSDLPENAASSSTVDTIGSRPAPAVAPAACSIMQIVRECGVELGGEIEFPSPPSSLADEANQTEFTQVEADSMFLEITPPEFQRDCSSKGLKEGQGEESNQRKDKIPYDLSISSENNVTKGSAEGGGDNSDDASLHDSMEILEEVATEDHFERDVVEEEEESDDEQSSLPNVTEEDMGSQAEGQQGQRPQQQEKRAPIIERIVTEEVIL